jgi:hypothetical protein
MPCCFCRFSSDTGLMGQRGDKFGDVRRRGRGAVYRVDDDGGLGHIALCDDKAKLFEGVGVKADVVVAAAHFGEVHAHGDVVGLGEAGAVYEEMRIEAAVILHQLRHRLRGAGEGVHRRCRLVLFSVAGHRRVGVLRWSHLHAVLGDGHDVAGHGAFFGVVLHVEALGEGALQDGTDGVVWVIRSGGCGCGIGVGLGRRGCIDLGGDIEAVEVDPGGSAEDGVVVAVEGEGNEVEYGGVLHVEAPMAEVRLGIDDRAIGRGVDIDDERAGVWLGRRVLLGGGRLREQDRRAKDEKSKGSADDLHRRSD